MKHLALLLALLLPCVAHGQYSTEAFQVKKLGDQYDHRGFLSGKPVAVDGKLSLSTAGGTASYVYPVSSYTSNGHSIAVSLNYCGAASFSSFHRYYDNGVIDNWSKFHKSAPLWLLSVNGFAVQTLSFAATFYNDPFFMRRNNELIQPPLAAYSDQHLVWTVDGYDVCNRMKHLDVPTENMQDAIRLLRGDGSILELRNAISYDNIPEGPTKNYTNTALYTGDYYPHDLNNAGYARVLFDSAYIKPGYSMAEPFRVPRVLKYYPGDGLEYVFREFVLPFGKEVPLVQWSNGNTGVPAFGGYKAGPTIFYLEEINDGSATVVSFRRDRHLYEEQRNLHPDSAAVVCTPTRGRALLTGFTGHTIIYGSNSMVIQALGRTTTVKFTTALSGSGYRSTLAGSSAMFPLAAEGAPAPSTTDLALAPHTEHTSYCGFVSSITDPENRVTQFDYGTYTRTFEGMGFPHDLNYNEELPIRIADRRLTSVAEPTAEHVIEYHGSTTHTLRAGAGELSSPDPAVQLQVKYALNPAVRALKKYDRHGRHLSTQKFGIDNRPVPMPSDFPGYLQEQWVSADTIVDEVTRQQQWTEYYFQRYEFPSFKSPYQNNQALSYTQTRAQYHTAGGQRTSGETRHACIAPMLIRPVSSTTRVASGGGAFVVKSAESYQYDTTTVRFYASNPGLKDTLGREIAEQRVLILNPADPQQVLLRRIVNFQHIPLKDTTLFLRQRQWNKFAALAEYFRQDSLARLNGTPVVWEEVMHCIDAYDTTEGTGLRTLPPIYNLERRTVIADANGVIEHGTARLYATSYRQEDTTAIFRGALLADSLIGRGGVRLPANRYTYWGGVHGYNKTLLRTRTTANGAVTEYGYDCLSAGGSGAIRYNDNSTGTAELLARRGVNEYESPLAETQQVRSYNGGVFDVLALQQRYERTYYDQISATVDANGWYSRFDYDNNGRLKTAWLPYDFQGDSVHSAPWYGTLTVKMPGYTLYRRRLDTVYCNGAVKLGGAMTTPENTRMVAARPVTALPSCGGTFGGKREEVQLANKIVFENARVYRGYCSGATSQELADAVSIDEATLMLHLSKVVGQCVNLRVSVLEPHNILNRWGDNKFDTLHTQVFVLNCPEVMQVLSAKLAGGAKREGGAVLSGDADVPYRQLKMDLENIRTDLLNRDWVVEVAVLTSGAEVEFVGDAEDYQPRLELRGSFRRVYALADYTLQYSHYDAGRKPLGARSVVRAKLDDSLHSSNRIGGDALPVDNSRYTEKEHVFGGDYRVVVSREVVGTPGAPSSWRDSVLYSHSGMGKELRISDQLGDTVSTSYDVLGRPVKICRDDGTCTHYEYQTGAAAALVGDNEQDFYGFCSVVITTQANGIWPEYRKEYHYYDAFGRLRREKGAYGRMVKYEYDLFDRLTTVVNPKGDTTRYWYDEFSRIRYKYQPDMGYTSYSYDHAGNIRFTQTQQQAGNGSLTFMQYDDMNRVTLIGEARLDSVPSTGGGGGGHALMNPGSGKRETVMGFPPHPVVNLNRLTDALDGSYLHDDGMSGLLTANRTLWLAPQTAVPSFWSMSALTETSCIPQPAQSGPVFPYLQHPANIYGETSLAIAQVGSFENIARYPQNARVAVQYDVLPQPGGSVWTYFPAHAQWDALMPGGRVQNLKGREAAVAYRQHAGEPYHFAVMSYDERGRMEAIVHYTENLGFDAVYYTYNSMNMVTSIRVVDPQRQYTTWYGYNANGHIDSVWTKLSAVGMGLGVANPIYRQPEARGADADIAYSYTKRWQVATMAYPPIQTLLHYSYNGKGLLDSMIASRNGNVLFQQALSYDSLDCLTRQVWRHSGQSSREHRYLYNKHQWLEGVFEAGGGYAEAFYYDPVGNRTSHSRNAGATGYQYEDSRGPNRISRTIAIAGAADTTDYFYNANGALVGRVTHNGTRSISEQMTYDPIMQQMKQYQRTEGTASEDWRYRSNAAGEREQKRVYATTQAPVKEWTYYLLSPTKQQLAVYRGVETRQSSCGGTAESSVYFYPAEYLTYGAGRVHTITVRPQAAGMKKEYSIQDYLGSTRVVLDQYGSIIGQYDYDAFGEVEWASAPEQRVSWIGKEKDQENSLGDFGARKYESRIGRFTSIDPLWEKYRSLTPYHYGANNPFTYIDPSGLEIWISYSEQVEGNRYENRQVQYRDGKVYNADGTEYQGNNKFVAQALTYLNELKATGHAEIVKRLTQLEKSKQQHSIHQYDHVDDRVNTASPRDIDAAKAGISVDTDVLFSADVARANGQNPLVVLAHELLGHSYHYDVGNTNWGEFKGGLPRREAQAVNIENTVNAILGYPKRTTYRDAMGTVHPIPSWFLWDTHRRRQQ